MTTKLESLIVKWQAEEKELVAKAKQLRSDGENEVSLRYLNKAYRVEIKRLELQEALKP